MRIQINGEQREFSESSLSLDNLIKELSLAPQRIAIELNKAIVRRSDWEKTTLKDGDQIEIVHFVGGGTTASSGETTGKKVMSIAALAALLPTATRHSQALD